MAKISKTLAHQIAGKVVEKIQVEIDKTDKEMKEEVTEMYKKKLPVDVLKMWEKYSEYMQSTSYARINNRGFKSRDIYLTSSLPKSIIHGYSPELEITDAQSKVLHKLDNKMIDLKEKKRRTLKEIESTLLALGTTKRVAEQFPELVQYLPTEGNTSLMHVPEHIRNTVKCLISNDAKCIDKI